MADIYQTYNLSAPLPPSTYSSVNSVGARFPNFEDASYRMSNGTIPANPASALRAFMSDLYDVHFKHEFYVQVRVAGVFLCILVLIAGAIILRRIYQGSFWVVRIVRKPAGPMVNFNSAMVFALLEGLYAMTLSTWLFLMPWYYDRPYQASMAPSTHICWALFSWCPLIGGALWAASGVITAIPSTDDVDRANTSNIARLRLLVLNALSLLSPFIVFASVAAAAIPSTLEYSRSLKMYKTWKVQFASDAVLSHDMLEAAANVRAVQLHSIWYASIAFTVWCFAAVCVTSIYGWAGWKLLGTISRQIRSLRMESMASKTQATSAGIQSLLYSGPAGANSGTTTLVDADLEKELDDDEIDPEAASLPEVSDKRNMSFFPPVRTANMRNIRSATSRNTTQATGTGNTDRREVQTSFLKKIRDNFMINYVGKFVAEICFTGLAIYITSIYYRSYEEGGNAVSLMYESALMWASWASVFFGLITLLCIAQRVYEPILDSLMAVQSESRRRERRAANAARRLLEGSIDRKQLPTSPSASRFPKHWVSPPSHSKVIAGRALPAIPGLSRDETGRGLGLDLGAANDGDKVENLRDDATSVELRRGPSSPSPFAPSDFSSRRIVPARSSRSLQSTFPTKAGKAEGSENTNGCCAHCQRRTPSIPAPIAVGSSNDLPYDLSFANGRETPASTFRSETPYYDASGSLSQSQLP